jgi:formylglycine-generating enzyme required for sulfatase activity
MPNTGDPPADGSVWQGGDESTRVLRGGAWYNFYDILRSAFRHAERPDYRVSIVGFRVARSLAATPQPTSGGMRSPGAQQAVGQP